MNTFKDIVASLWRISNGTKGNGDAIQVRMWTVKGCSWSEKGES